jgi:fluoride exporter
MLTPLLVAVGAAVGAPLRYLTDQAVRARQQTPFPWGTLTANLIGCCLLGFLAGGAQANAVNGEVMALLGTGLCGALTTYSTFGYETIRLMDRHTRPLAVFNAVSSVLGGLGAAFTGMAIAQAIWG